MATSETPKRTDDAKAADVLLTNTAATDYFFNSSLDLMCIAGFDGFFKRLNPMWEQITGFSNDELMAEPFINFVHPDDRESTIAAAGNLSVGQAVVRFENRYRCKDNSYCWIEWTASAVVEHQLIYAVAREIGKHKEAAQQAALYEAIVANMPVGVYVWRLEEPNNPTSFRLMTTNAAAQVASGLDNSGNHGKLMTEVMPGLFETSLPAIYMNVIQTKQPCILGDVEYSVNTVKPVIFEISAFPMPNDAVCIMFENVTERRKMEGALRENEAQLRSIMSNFPLILFSVDKDGKVLVSEGRGLETLGLKPGQIVGQSVYDLYRDIPDIAAYIRRGLQGEQISYTLNIGNIIFETILTPVIGANGKVEGAIGISSDITERRRSEEIIHAQSMTLQELSTPLLVIREGLVVMPLIGAIDSRRAQLVMESLLHGVSTYNASTAIIDITGVAVVDTQVANALLRAAQAVRLLGANAVLTGIRPEVAQTLVQLGVDLSGIITRGTLQAGISYALQISK